MTTPHEEETLLLLYIEVNTVLLKRWLARGLGPDLYSHSAPTG